MDIDEDLKKDLEMVLGVIDKMGGVDASAVVARDGSLMASNIPPDVHPEVFGAMSATMLMAAETAVGELKKGATDFIIIQSKDAKVIAMGAGPTALVVTMISPATALGLILMEMERASEKIKALM
ncbi:MAG: roadblock/LC7 domain-containing protein [Candidatus Hydrothermarchaeaceae archaeon]